MSALLRRVAGVFVAPAEGASAPPAARRAVASGARPALLAASSSASSSTTLGRRPTPVSVPIEVLAAAAAPAPAAARAAAPEVASLAVVCHARDVATAGCAVALALAEHRRSRCAVVLEWTGVSDRELVPRPAVPSARRMATALAALELAAVACGRLVRVALPGAGEAAPAAAARVQAALPQAPHVLAVGGPRSDALDRLVAVQDAAVLATRPDADEALVALAETELRSLCGAVRVVELPPAPVAGALARAGFALTSPLRAAVLPGFRLSRG